MVGTVIYSTDSETREALRGLVAAGHRPDLRWPAGPTIDHQQEAPRVANVSASADA
jgi:hypothetical protein